MNRKLTDEQVREIRTSVGASRYLAPKYGVTDRYIRYIRSGTKRQLKEEVINESDSGGGLLLG